ncbi:thioredoxin family protein [Pedococcus sp. 5OH_020]|uniref:thioredoxin family protein n=1 Tax=Pedococcus sp. 5OH_020 TaxID=2989814 RepID=UPI0022E9E49E|nr:thioredoxin family protein [Pedococcus sp. 5OH_020]
MSELPAELRGPVALALGRAEEAIPSARSRQGAPNRESRLAQRPRGGESVRHVVVEASEQAERLGFMGSPTIMVDGKDPFATGAEQPAWACRVSMTPDGLAGSPTVEQLVEVLS